MAFLLSSSNQIRILDTYSLLFFHVLISLVSGTEDSSADAMLQATLVGFFQFDLAHLKTHWERFCKYNWNLLKSRTGIKTSIFCLYWGSCQSAFKFWMETPYEILRKMLSTFFFPIINGDFSKLRIWRMQLKFWK